MSISICAGNPVVDELDFAQSQTGLSVNADNPVSPTGVVNDFQQANPDAAPVPGCYLSDEEFRNRGFSVVTAEQDHHHRRIGSRPAH
jgi:hypothetical protein